MGTAWHHLITNALVITLKTDLADHWRDIRALADCIEEVRERLGGEDPAHPMVKEALENARPPWRCLLLSWTTCRSRSSLLSRTSMTGLPCAGCWSKLWITQGAGKHSEVTPVTRQLQSRFRPTLGLDGARAACPR